MKNGTFEGKELSINSDFQYYPSNWTHGSYTFTDKVSNFGTLFIDPHPSTGKYLIADVDESTERRVWYDTVYVAPNTTYVFSCLAANVYKPARDPFNAPIPAPLIKLCVNGKKQTMLLLPEASSEWKVISGVFTSGPSQTKVEISIENLETAHMGNDVAIDNIFFGQADKEEKENVQIVEKKDSLVKQEMATVKEELPVKVKDTIALLPVPVLAKADTVKTEVKPIQKATIKKDTIKSVSSSDEKKNTEVKKIVTPTVAVKKKVPPVPTNEIKKTEVKKTATVPPKKPVPSAEVKKKANPPVVVKKTVPAPTKKPAASTVVKKNPNISPAAKDKPKTVASSSAFDKDIKKENMYVGQKLELKHIYFERSMFDLLETSLPELNNLVEFMNHYPSVKIRLEGHTDNVGDASKNIELSENRVKAVKKYLVDHKIAENRIECIGHGGSKALNGNLSEEEKKLNRRVEVVIIAK